MGILYWVRVGVMTLTLLLIASIIYSQQKGQSALQNFTNVFFSAPTDGRHKVVLCPTRVKSIQFPSGATLEQAGMDWARTQNNGQQILDTIGLEKWFGRYCTINAELAPTSALLSPGLETLATWRYIQGEDQLLQKNTAGVYVWQNVAFISPTLDTALQELEALISE